MTTAIQLPGIPPVSPSGTGSLAARQPAIDTAAVEQLTLLSLLDQYAQDGLLRRLGPAFARFMASLGMTEPAHILTCILLSELEGRGHSCLLLSALTSDPCALLGWKASQWQTLALAADPLPDSLEAWRSSLSACAQVWAVNADTNQGTTQDDLHQALVLDQDRLYLRRYWRDETSVARAIISRAATVRAVDPRATRQWLDTLFDTEPTQELSSKSSSESSSEQVGVTEPDWQKIACAIALRSNLTIITGGPGTGKTYTVARLLALLFAMTDKHENLRIALAAPTGKAAARLKQSIDDALNGLAAKVGEHLPLAQLTSRIGAARTLHSLLGARPDTRAFAYHSGNELDIDVLIVDEASMVHLEMMAAILAALPANAMLILLGDKDQLASVEAGAVLGDLCRHAQDGDYLAATLQYVLATSGQKIAPAFTGHGSALSQQTVMLRKSLRFSGPIGDLALAVNAGDTAKAIACLRASDDKVLSWITHAQAQEMVELALDGRPGAPGGYRSYLTLLSQAPPTTGNTGTNANGVYDLWAAQVLERFESFRILCAVREGEWGVAGLNLAIEQRLEKEGLIRRRSEWYAGRPVMITRNDHGTGVFNGDIGITLPDPQRSDSLRVYFLEGKTVRSVLATRLRHVATAYAMTVHKSQGSEFSHTVMVLPKESSPVVSRELVYTGITRARKNFTLVSPVASVFEEALKRRTQRASGLGSLLNA